MLPLVAIVGRPNVGKSTLFNRLVRRRTALVANEPGLTRDRHYGLAEWDGRMFQLVDTGGFESDAKAGMETLIRLQTQVAIDEADVVVIVTDARGGVTSTDRDLIDILRRTAKPVLYVANKVEGPRQDAALGEFYELGIPHIFAVSAEHGRGCDALVDALLEKLPPPASPPIGLQPAEDEGLQRRIRVALVGRPNSGKSALLNRLVGAQRAIVSDVPGTTRDPIDVEIESSQGTFTIVDTAGIRRKRRAAPFMEQIAVLQAHRCIQEADVVCLLIDGDAGVGAQDAKIAAATLDAGRGLVLVFSKSDLMGPAAGARNRVLQQIDDRLHFAAFAPHLLISSLTGRAVDKLLPAVRRVNEHLGRRITTGELNRFFAEITEAHGAPSYRGRPVRLFYITQAQVRPPTFVVSTNQPAGVPESYRRYLVNRIRKNFRFDGTPIRLLLRGKKDRHAPRKRA